MSNIDKEWLQQKIADMEATRDEIPFGLDEDDSNTLAALRIALASLEAEPVAWLLSGGGAKNNVSFDSGNAYADPLREVTPLYTAPPAPVSVPAAMEMDDDFDSAFEHGKAVGWNAYRAAMLQSLGNSEQLEPVTTANKLPECWVACSERMPDDEEDVLCFGQYGDNDIDEERYQFMGWLSSKGIKRVWRVSDGDSQNRRARVTHWMPLPAAPHREGENV
ncbi:DUF551 domain-containing protein [Enterobacter hormaechei subsp. hoffmannii]|uniref:DUF551 domain-containing protein n=1 Tax=Enterobacter hormaechei TaxID=158836 RepID=UPI00079C1231|nr:DUF551 domain-containing protein [Enterobacter hormaechei]MCU2659676.1 DUF551 domain-containing protein [Enterobacter hormaechei subsp. hoffmannii]SAG24754.1 Protein of uncharacterised function (DUF551) [Enterobacter hormaechei]SAG93656.1 Protein of uncharacterised function (DUF551) [Enterobacter hormaechei]VAC67493.1 Protein of uncharacterised function (DUF551) [Enterobacter hormaechei]